MIAAVERLSKPRPDFSFMQDYFYGNNTQKLPIFENKIHFTMDLKELEREKSLEYTFKPSFNEKSLIMAKNRR